MYAIPVNTNEEAKTMTKNKVIDPDRGMQKTETGGALQAQDAGLPMDAARAMAEVKGAILVAQHVPRNEERAFRSIINACKRRKLAEQSQYVYNRGNVMVEGPSIRLAETAARYWGNLQYGVRELRSSDDETTYEAFCWDVETNVRVNRAYTAKHVRYSRNKGVTKLTDPRDQYEAVASSAARRLRACILEVIPGDVIDSAVEQCNETLKGGTGPIEDRVRKMVLAFADVGVDEEMLASRLSHPLNVTTEIELVQLTKIYHSLKDGMSKPVDWFGAYSSDDKDVTKVASVNDLNDRFRDQPQATEPKGNGKNGKEAVQPKGNGNGKPKAATQPSFSDFENHPYDDTLGGAKGVPVDEHGKEVYNAR